MARTPSPNERAMALMMGPSPSREQGEEGAMGGMAAAGVPVAGTGAGTAPSPYGGGGGGGGAVDGPTGPYGGPGPNQVGAHRGPAHAQLPPPMQQMPAPAPALAQGGPPTAPHPGGLTPEEEQDKMERAKKAAAAAAAAAPAPAAAAGKDVVDMHKAEDRKKKKDTDDKMPPVPERVKVGASPEFIVDKRLGKGGFGQVYKGKRSKPPRKTTGASSHKGGGVLNEVALKFEHKNSKGCVRGPPYEWEVYKQLGRTYGLPKVHFYGMVGDFYVMVMDILGPSLWDTWNENGNALSEMFVACIAMEAIAILQGLHSRGYVHGDVKPENFLLGSHDVTTDGQQKRLYLVDLGLAMKWQYQGGQHTPYDQKPDDFRGTIRYASVHAHLGRTASRRDDLESLAYTLVFLLRGSLPWQGYQGDNKGFWVCKTKMQTSAELLCRYCNPAFAQFTDAVINLKFDEEPRYSAYIQIFETFTNGAVERPLNVDCGLEVSGRFPKQALFESKGRKESRIGWPASQWITVYNKQAPMKQRYHYNVASDRLSVHIHKGYADGLFISSVACCQDFKAPWAIIMDAGTNFHEQMFHLAPGEFLPKSWIMDGWEEGYYITALAGTGPPATSDYHPSGALVVMSKGTPYTQQSYKISETFPYEWIKRKWREGFFITSIGTSSHRKKAEGNLHRETVFTTTWAVVMSRNSSFETQCVELDFQYPSEGIHRRWVGHYRITACAATPVQAAFVLSTLFRRPVDETQETLRTSAFPAQHIKEKWTKDLYVAGIGFGRTVC